MSEQTFYFWRGCPLWLESRAEGATWQLLLRNTGWQEIGGLTLWADGTLYEYTQPLAVGATETWQVGCSEPESFMPVCVRFTDGVEWTNDQPGMVIGPPQAPDTTQEFFDEFAEAWKDTAPLYQPEQHKDYWRCGCGQINDAAHVCCNRCLKSRQWVQEHLDAQRTHETLLKKAALAADMAKQQAELEACLQQKKKKIRRWCSLGVASLALVLALVLVINLLFIPGRHYAKASAYLALDRFYEAYTEFELAGNYRDSEAQLVEISRRLSGETSISAGKRHVVKNNRQGKTEGVGYALDTQLMVDKWNAIRAVSCGKDHTLGLHYSGTVMAVGNKKTGALNVKNWLNMIAVGAGDGFSVGLQKDGKVLAVGQNGKGQCNVKGWTDITAIAVGEDFTLGLKADGTVVATGNNDAGQCDVSQWKDIIFIAAGNSHALGLKADGTVVAAGENKHKEIEVSGWQDIIALAGGDGFTLGLKADGTVVATGKNDRGQTEVEGLSDIIAITCGWDFAVVVDGNGTPVYLGTDADGESKFSNWTLHM